ncbi:MAG: hypothetical protein IPM29_27705 [Planctomycetes bacterium]|nr:hypothetical protein [Planctomycetota bacterium]
MPARGEAQDGADRDSAFEDQLVQDAVREAIGRTQDGDGLVVEVHRGGEQLGLRARVDR